MSSAVESATGPIEPEAYYVALPDGRFRSTVHAQGAWSPDHQHMGPVSGLLVHAIEQCAPRDDLMLARVSFDILGVIQRGEVEVTASVARPGRTVELVEATFTAGGRTAVRAHAWRLLRSPTTEIAGTALTSIPGPDAATPWDGSETWSGGFIRSLEIRVLPGWRPGRGQVWLRSRVGLVEATAVSDLSRLFAVTDTMNGVAVRQSPDEVAFPNTDLTVHVFREPVGEWLGLDVEVTFGASGVGMTSAVLHDVDGPYGRALQILTVRPLPE